MKKILLKSIVGNNLELILKNSSKLSEDESELIDKTNSGEWVLVTTFIKSEFNETKRMLFTFALIGCVGIDSAIVHENKTTISFVCTKRLSTEEKEELVKKIINTKVQ